MTEPRAPISRRAALLGLAGLAGALVGCRSESSASPSSGGAGVKGTASVAPPTPAAPVRWVPDRPLPLASPGRRVNIILTPHPDDETLSMGVWAVNAIRRGERVIVVCLTDGRTSTALKTISKRLGRPLSREDLAAARVREMRSAVASMGVAPDDVYLTHLDGEATAGGARLTQGKAYAVIKAFVQRFPAATYVTMSYVAERQPDHLNAGRALWQAMSDGTVRHGLFAVSRLWWGLSSPPITQVLPASPYERSRVLTAARSYDVWDPARQRYGVGWASVPTQFLELEADPRDHIHPWAPLPPSVRP